MEAFEELEVWRRSCRLSVELYRTLRHSTNYGFKQQVMSSALSIPSNIAEEYERDSTNEYIRFLRIAKGSCGELRTQLYIGKAAGLLDVATIEVFIKEATEISRMIQGVIKGIQNRRRQDQ